MCCSASHDWWAHNLLKATGCQPTVCKGPGQALHHLPCCNTCMVAACFQLFDTAVSTCLHTCPFLLLHCARLVSPLDLLISSRLQGHQRFAWEQCVHCTTCLPCCDACMVAVGFGVLAAPADASVNVLLRCTPPAGPYLISASGCNPTRAVHRISARAALIALLQCVHGCASAVVLLYCIRPASS